MADVVLVDSRTGVTEIGGVCTHQLADVVVSFVATNEQNLEGTLMMATSFSQPALIHQRGRPLDLIFVPSRVEPFVAEKLDQFALRFNDSLSKYFTPKLTFEKGPFIDLRIPYTPEYAYVEDVAVRQGNSASKSYLIEAFQKLGSTLARLAPVGSRLLETYDASTAHLIKQADQFISELPKEDLNLARELLSRVVLVSADGDFNVRKGSWGQKATGRTEWIIARLNELQVFTTESDKEDTRFSLGNLDLIEDWSTLRSWLDEDREFLTWRQQIGAAAALWQSAKRDPGGLLSGELLSQAINMRRGREIRLNPEERIFIQTSELAKDTRRDWIKLAPPPRPLTGADKWHVFLSYRSVNRSWVLNLYDVLRQQGFSVFLDQCELRPGDSLLPRLESALGASQSAIMVMSAATADSAWDSREYRALERMAIDKTGFQFVPIKLDHSQLPFFTDNRVYLDFSSYPDGPNGGDLLRLLHVLADKPFSPEAAHFAVEQDEAARAAVAKIGAAIRNGNAERLIQLFAEGGLVWQTSSSLGCKAAEGLTKLNRNDEAIALLDKIRQRFPKAIRPKQLYALALARRDQGDDLMNAQDILGELYESGERDPETLGIYAGTWMDRYAKSNNEGDLKQSRDYYAEAFERALDDYHTGINAAAKSVFLGTPEDLEKGSAYAAKVQKIVGSQAIANDYWMTATVAEVFLIQNNYAEAGRLYEAAVAMARQQTASHKSTWTQACRLMAKLQPNVKERAMVRRAFAHLPDCP